MVQEESSSASVRPSRLLSSQVNDPPSKRSNLFPADERRLTSPEDLGVNVRGRNNEEQSGRAGNNVRFPEASLEPGRDRSGLRVARSVH